MTTTATYKVREIRQAGRLLGYAIIHPTAGIVAKYRAWHHATASANRRNATAAKLDARPSPFRTR